MLHRQVKDTAGLNWTGERNVGGRPAGNDAPYEAFSSAAPLMKKLDGSHHGAKVSAADRTLVRLWLDSATPYAGTYAAYGTGQIGAWWRNNEPVREMANAWPSTRPAIDAFNRRCAACHVPGTMPRFVTDTSVNSGDGHGDFEGWCRPVFRTSRHHLYNLSRPEQSLVLKAPLAKAAGGDAEGALPAPPRPVPVNLAAAPKPVVHPVVFASTDDPDYQAILAMAQAGKKRLGDSKRFDMPGFRPRPEYFREMQRYGLLPAAFDPAKDQVDPYQLDRRYWASLVPAPMPADAVKPGYPFIACDVDTYEVTQCNAAGEPVWVYTQVRPIDAWLMPDDAVLISYLPSPRTGDKGGIRLVSQAKQTIFDYPYKDEIMSCQPMPNGNILVNECDAGKITEIDRTGKALRSFEVKAKGMGHATARFIRLTPQNTVLVGECYSNKLREYDFTGKLLKEWDLPMAYSASRLANGNTLISGYKPAKLAEIDPDGKTVWSLTAADLPAELNIGSFCESTRLANGNTLVACASRSAKPGPRVVYLEVTPDKKIAWKQMEPSLTRETTALKPLGEALGTRH